MSYLAAISLYSILLPSGMVFLRWFRLPLSLRIVSVFILLKLVLESVSYGFFLMGKNNMMLFHAFTFIEHIFLILYFRSLFDKPVVRRILELIMVLFLVFSALNLLFWTPLDNPPSMQRSFECIIGMLLCIYFFVDLFLKSHVTDLAKYPHYWMVSGFLLYFAGTFFLNIVGDIAIATNELSFDAYDINSVLNTFLNIIFTIVLWMGSRESTSEQ